MRQDLDLPLPHPGREVGDDLAEGLLRIIDAERIRTDPHAGLVGLEAGLEIGHEDVQKVPARPVELAEMRPPGHLAERFDPRVSQRDVQAGL